MGAGLVSLAGWGAAEEGVDLAGGVEGPFLCCARLTGRLATAGWSGGEPPPPPPPTVVETGRLGCHASSSS
jgi:hypothetical protein